MEDFYEPALETAHVMSSHVLLARTARESGKCSPAECPGGRGNECGELPVSH